jgi:hypothetical protein
MEQGKLTLLTFENIFDRLTYEDKKELKKRLNIKIFTYYFNNTEKKVYFIHAINKTEAIKKLLEQKDFIYKYLLIYRHHNEYFKCLVCEGYFHCSVSDSDFNNETF